MAKKAAKKSASKKAVTRKAAAKKSPASPTEFMATLEHPLKAGVEALRRIIGAADGRLVEGIKWNAPSFALEGEDRITLNLSAKDRVRVIFHRGAKVKGTAGKDRLIEDPAGLLEWPAPDRAIATFISEADIKKHKAVLGKLAKAWLAATAAF